MASAWDRLREVLRELQRDRRRPLQMYPGPDSDQSPPFRIHLKPWATEIAADLHGQFGSDVVITVGSLRFPDRRRLHPDGSERPAPTETRPHLPPGLTVSLEEPIRMPSGATVHAYVRVHNDQSSPAFVSSNGLLNARVVVPATGQIVGGYSGASPLVGVIDTIPPHGSKVLRLLIGTACSVPELGYAIPPGEWAVVVTITLTTLDHPPRRVDYRADPLPITITSDAIRASEDLT